MRSWDILGIGAVAVDDLVYLEGYPEPDSKTPVLEERREGGGLAGTALVAAARLGARAAYAGVLGDDELSRFTLTELVAAGVDCSMVKYQPGARPIHSIILVNRLTGQRTILYSLAGVTPLTPEEMTGELIGRCRLLFVDSTVAPLALHALRLAHRLGIPVVADLERTTPPEVLDLAREVDHLIVGTEFARELTGEEDPARAVCSLYSPRHLACVVTAGDQGCWYIAHSSPGTVCHQLAFQVSVVDTTGCGDVFHGAYAACIATGESIEQAVVVATAAAALKATQPGGRRGIPDRPTVEKFLQQQRARAEQLSPLCSTIADVMPRAGQVHDSVNQLLVRDTGRSGL